MSFDGDLYPEAGASKVITTQGDIVRGDASGNRERLGIGSNLQQLQSNGTTLSWQTITAGATVEVLDVTGATNGQTSTSTTNTDIAGMSGTLPNITNGKCLIVLFASGEHDTVTTLRIGIELNGSDQVFGQSYTSNTGEHFTVTVSDNDDSDGGTVQGRMRIGSGTITINNVTNQSSRINVLGVG